MRVVSNMLLTLSFLGIGLTIGGCDDDSSSTPAIIGDWEEETTSLIWADNFNIRESLSGYGEFYITTYGDTLFYCKYDLEAEKDGGIWVIYAENQSSDSYGFQMECEADGEELDCECVTGFCEGRTWIFERV